MVMSPRGPDNTPVILDNRTVSLKYRQSGQKPRACLPSINGAAPNLREVRLNAVMEAQVIGLVAAGRREAALQLVLGAFQRKVFRLAFSFLRDREAAEDVAQ